MSWTTVYIKGRNDFQGAVLSKLKGAWLMGSSEAKGDLVMFWLPETVPLKSLKIAIGSKLMLKYRLHFISDLNFHLKLTKRQSTQLTPSENEMIDKMVRSDSAQREGHKQNSNMSIHQ